MIDDLIPMVDRTYRTLADREQRAMAGLSMGSMQTLDITLRNLDLFAWIGSFSGPLLREERFDVATVFDGVFADADMFNRRVKLCGWALAPPSRASTTRPKSGWRVTGCGIHCGGSSLRGPITSGRPGGAA